MELQRDADGRRRSSEEAKNFARLGPERAPRRGLMETTHSTSARQRIARLLSIAILSQAVALNACLVAAAPTLVGDYNNNGSVGGSDFTVWRDCLGGDTSCLPNRDPFNGHEAIKDADYTSWDLNYGADGPDGSISSVPGPQLSIVNLGPNGSGNLVWSVRVTPRELLFANHPPNGVGGSIATEIGFTVTQSSLVSATANATNFPFNNQGESPFFFGDAPTERGVTRVGNQFFAALGSTYFTTADPKEILRIETLGVVSTEIVWSGSYGSTGLGLLAQAGQGFGVSGMATFVPGLAGDFNDDNVVDAADYTVWRNNYGDLNEANLHYNGDGGGIGDGDFLLWRQHYGQGPDAGGGGGMSAIPEPATGLMIGIAVAMLLSGRRHSIHGTVVTGVLPFSRVEF
jgi:hypothetical protein